MPVEAAGSEQGSRQQEETATRGKFISQRIAVFACRRTSVRRNRRLKRQPLFPTFGFACAAGPNHWPKERSAGKPERKERSAVRPKQPNPKVRPARKVFGKREGVSAAAGNILAFRYEKRKSFVIFVF